MNEKQAAHSHALVGGLRLATLRLQLSSPSGFVFTPRSFFITRFLDDDIMLYDEKKSQLQSMLFFAVVKHLFYD
jgi:hypothetical protein